MPHRLLLAAGAGLIACGLTIAVLAVGVPRDSLVSDRTVGNMRTTATPARVHAGNVVRLTLTVTGPAQYGSCRPVAYWADDARGKRAWTEVQFWMCPLTTAVPTIDTGKTASFWVDWTTRGMKSGIYTIHGSFGVGRPSAVDNIPTVQVEIVP